MAEINSEELALKARNTLGTMLDYLGLNAELKAEVNENNLALKIKIISALGLTEVICFKINCL